LFSLKIIERNKDVKVTENKKGQKGKMGGEINDECLILNDEWCSSGLDNTTSGLSRGYNENYALPQPVSPPWRACPALAGA
jgi:hypothetical protein